MVAFAAEVEGGLLDDEEIGGEPAGGIGDSGQCDDARAIGREEGVFVAPVAAGSDVETAEEGGGLGEQFGGLAVSGSVHGPAVNQR